MSNDPALNKVGRERDPVDVPGRGASDTWWFGSSTSPLERMRSLCWPKNRRSPPQQLGVDYDRLMFNRALLLWLHFALGLTAAFMYLSTFDHSHLRWWGRFGIHLVSLSNLSWIPYLISGVYSRRRLPARQFGIWLFVLSLLAGTAAMGYFYLTAMVNEIPVFGAIIIQTAAYVVAAQVLLGRDMAE
jgi:hypothetical protein